MSPARLNWQRWPLRTTLTVVIAGLFVLAASSALAIQYVVVSQALDQQVQTARVGSGTAPVPTAAPTLDVPVQEESQSCGGECSEAAAPSPAPGAADYVQKVTTLRDSVMSAMGMAMIASFAAFAIGAVLVARWVAAGIAQRIAVISDLASRLDPSDLGQRIPEATPADEIGQLAHTLNEMLARIESAVAMQRQFIANASHELRTPIAAVQTNLEAPLAQGRFPADVVPAVRRALSANQKSAALITSLLQLARAQGRIDLQLEPFDLVRAARGELADLASLSAEKSLQVSVGPGRAAAWADPALAELAVRNVMDNAIIHALAGGTVEVGVAEADSMVVLTVSNSAALSDGVELEELLQPFHRGPDSRMARVPGFGLGLAIAESALIAQGGWLQLGQSGGHTFRVDLALPAAAAGGSDDTTEAP